VFVLKCQVFRYGVLNLRHTQEAISPLMASCTKVVASDYDLQAHGATVDMVHGFIA